VTVQALPGPRLVPVHVSAVVVNAAEPARVTVSAELPDPPELVSVNVVATAWPAGVP
jgi:hypothetical protein